jgi:hypothetical protein
MVDPIVTYRYTITMPDRRARYSELKNKWLDSSHFNQLYNGKLLYAVSPIFDDGDYYLTQIQLDLEPPRPKNIKGTYQVFEFVQNFIRNHKDYYYTYTGRYGFHIYSKFVIRTKKVESSILRKYLLQPLNITSEYLDSVASIRRMPTIRIGLRPDNGKLAIPVLDPNKDFDYILKSRESKDFSNLFTKLDLKKFIEDYLMPVQNEISYKEYKKSLKKVISDCRDFLI